MDILTAIEKRTPTKTLPTKRMMWVVSLGNGKLSKLHSYNKARRLAKRYNRIFKSDAAYASRFGTV